jgi:hypothetical protein
VVRYLAGDRGSENCRHGVKPREPNFFRPAQVDRIRICANLTSDGSGPLIGSLPFFRVSAHLRTLVCLSRGAWVYVYI